MAKKYLSLEEAAAILGVKPDDLVRLRERGEIRGFADRGTWKFKSEDVEEFRRQRHPDSNPEVPLFDDDSSAVEASILEQDSDEVADQPTVIRGDSSGKVLDGTSDSDVRLIVDDNLVGGGPDSDPEVALPPLSDTDSDVRLIDEKRDRKREADSDSDVVLSKDSDSDVKLVGSDSDSDVRLVGDDSSMTSDSDSDVALVDTDDDTQPMKLQKGSTGSSVLADDSSVRGHDEDSGLTLESESGLALSEPDSGKLAQFDSGITLETGDSGISLESIDSGISLDASDSGISLDSGDSGISLEAAGDSGISLDDSGSYALADDSGIEVGSPSDSGIALDAIDAADSGNLARTAPMVGSAGDEDNLEATQMEMDSTPVQKTRGKKDAETSVILFDDESEAPAAPKSKAKAKADSSVEDFDTLESATFGIDDSYVEAVDFEDQDLEVVEDVLGDSSADFDEIESLEEMDVFDAADEDFEESFDSGVSEAEFTPSPATSGRIAMPTEANWGVPTFVGLCVSSVCMVLCGMLMFDLVNSMWDYEEPSRASGMIIDAVKGLFGN